jgi:hypothetical protein
MNSSTNTKYLPYTPPSLTYDNPFLNALYHPSTDPTHIAKINAHKIRMDALTKQMKKDWEKVRAEHQKNNLNVH